MALKQFFLAVSGFGALAVHASPIAAANSDWHRYANARFGYSICYPASFQPSPESENGDGREFVGRDGARLRVFGGYDALRQGPAREAEMEAGFAPPSGRVTYRATGRGWSVISGVQGERIVYLKTLARGDRLVTFRLDYPASLAATYRPIVDSIEHCFNVGSTSL